MVSHEKLNAKFSFSVQQVMDNTKDLLDIINSIVVAGERDAAIYTRDKRLFIVVKSPTLSYPLQYYDNDEPYTATYHAATPDWIDSLDVVCITHCNIRDGYPTVAFGSIASIPTLCPDETGSLKNKLRSRMQRLAEKSIQLQPPTNERTRAPRKLPEEPRFAAMRIARYEPYGLPKVGEPEE